MSVFTDRYKGVPKPKRNVFDLSFTNNSTFKMGYLYPVFCKEVIPSESMRIKPTFGLRLDPTLFPLQSKLRADLHFFYVRNRNLWTYWQDYMSNALPSGQSFPYISKDPSFFKTGSLSDYLGIPTTQIGSYNSSVVAEVITERDNFVSQGVVENANQAIFSSTYGFDPFKVRLPWRLSPPVISSVVSYIPNNYTLGSYSNGSTMLYASSINRIFTEKFRLSSNFFGKVEVLGKPVDLNLYGYLFVVSRPDGDALKVGSSDSLLLGSIPIKIAGRNLSFGNSVSLESVNTLIEQVLQRYGSYSLIFATSASNYGLTETGSPYVPDKPFVDFRFFKYFTIYTDGSSIKDSSELTAESHPFCNGEVPISALAFRAYRSIYNCYYRDNQNDPVTNLRGEPMYNSFLEVKTSGPDSFDYKLERRRWEADQFVSAMQSPQQGIAPLVGIQVNYDAGTTKLFFQNPDPNSTTGSVTVQVDMSEDAQTITGIQSFDGVNQATLSQLMQDISTGISINSLRNVNSLQRWLEKNIFLGYRYKDQIKSHFGVDARFDELDMPEFIGGTSSVFNMQSIRQTTPTADGSLGDYAGFGELFKNSDHSINHYFDEWGYVIGILSIHPVPTYSQTLPKHFTKTHNPLDFHTPEFNHIGFQPIPYAELCPLQSIGDNNTTFGYQKAWYDYMSSLDEAHGLFRTSLKDYLLMRLFQSKPSLTNPDFLYCDEESLNDVFAVTQTDQDHIKGIIYFDCQAKLPISKYGMPRLE